jgi:hypothetical protein
LYPPSFPQGLKGTWLLVGGQQTSSHARGAGKGLPVVLLLCSCEWEVNAVIILNSHLTCSQQLENYFSAVWN